MAKNTINKPDQLGRWMLSLSVKKVWLHVSFCVSVVLVTMVVTFFYRVNLNPDEFHNYGISPDYSIKVRESIIRDSILQISLVISIFILLAVYSGRWLCERWFKQNNLGKFVLGSILGGISLTLIGGFIVQYFFHPLEMRLFAFLLNFDPFIFIFLGAGTLIKMIRTIVRKQYEAAVIMSSQKQTELSLLQSQLSPHFLFNTLNNMYSISIVKSELVPGLLLKLSDLLRYSVYETREEFVPIGNELKYINNFIDFEKIRIGDRLDLELTINDASAGTVKIAPMILITFIENAFKFSKNSSDEKVYIKISLNVSEDEIILAVTNSFTTAQGDLPSDRSGLGLKTTGKRLDLLYPYSHSLEQTQKNGFYHIVLKLKTK